MIAGASILDPQATWQTSLSSATMGVDVFSPSYILLFLYLSKLELGSFNSPIFPSSSELSTPIYGAWKQIDPYSHHYCWFTLYNFECSQQQLLSVHLACFTSKGNVRWSWVCTLSQHFGPLAYAGNI
jgi:hypothetical protein